MNPTISKLRLLRPFLFRTFAEECPAAPVGGTSDYEIQNTKLPNGLTVASAENSSPICRISIIFRAGSRYEPPESLGLTHTLRICAGLSTKNATQFSIIRHIQQAGASLSCCCERETICYTLQGTRPAIEKTLPFLTEVATQQEFRPWEVAENVERQKFELKHLPPQQKVCDLLHKAAFRRGGLGNPLYIPEYNLGNISSESLQYFVKSHFTAGSAAVVGLGVEHSHLVKYAEGLELEPGESKSTPSPYKGGEIRMDHKGDMAFVAIAGQGMSMEGGKKPIYAAMLKRALGEGSAIKWGSARSGILGKSIEGGIPEPFLLSSFAACYTDEGLLGVLIAAPEIMAGRLVESVVKLLKTGAVEKEDFERGKRQVINSFLFNGENAGYSSVYMAQEAVLLGTARSVKQIVEDAEAVSVGDAASLFKQVAASKLSMACVGNLGGIPFLDEMS